MILGMFTPGPTEILIVCGIMLLVFGPKQVPKMARSLGSVLPSFKAGMKEVQDEIKEVEEVVKEATGDNK